MRYFVIPVLLIALASAISVAQDLPVAEVSLYGQALTPVTVGDITADGRVIYLRGVQYWPRLSAKTDEPVQQQNPTKEQLHDDVTMLEHTMLQQGTSIATIRDSMAAVMQRSPLVRDVRVPSDPNANWFEYRLVGDLTDDWMVREDIGLALNRPTNDELYQTELASLRHRIEHGWTMVVAPEGGFFVPPNARQNQKERIRQEIDAAINGTWSGTLLSREEVELFRHPLNIVAATDRFRRLHSQED